MANARKAKLALQMCSIHQYIRTVGLEKAVAAVAPSYEFLKCQLA